MNQIAPLLARLPAMSPQGIANIKEVERKMLALPQVPIKTLHVLHAGMYSRTVMIPAGVQLVGALIKIPTMLTIFGDVLMSLGEAQGIHLVGTHVIPGSAGRKQVFAANKDTSITMTFCTMAMTIEQAEAEFTDDTEILFSRRDPELNTIIITGE